MNETRILIIDDEQPIRKFLKTALTTSGYYVLEAESGQEGMRILREKNPDLILLDVSLPDKSGIEIVKDLRTFSSIPVIMLSVRNDEVSKVEALDFGADDYITKPFSNAELFARIRTALRHKHRMHSDQEYFHCGRLKVNFQNRTVFVEDQEVHLTVKEYSLLSILIEYAGRVITHKQLLHNLWGPENEENSHYLRIYIASLRKKIEYDPQRPDIIITEPGVGYRLRTDYLINS